MMSVKMMSCDVVDPCVEVFKLQRHKKEAQEMHILNERRKPT